MKRWLKITLGVVGIIVLLFAIDLICIFTINRPLFAIKEDNGDSVVLVYRGLFYDTYNCPEYSVPQIKAKGTKFNCAIERVDIGKVVEIIDKTKNMKDFACDEALEGFYADDKYIYFWSCMKNEYMIVKYESGFEETISNALKYGTISISDLDRFNISYIKQNKYDDYKPVSSLKKVQHASTEILVQFDGVLYGKSNSIIDYAGGTEKIGIIDKVIDSNYVPKYDGETNREEIKNAEVYDKTDKSIVLLYNNEYVLFEKLY